MFSSKELFRFPFKKNARITSASNVRPSAKKTGLTGAAVSDVGCIRPNNEDNFIMGTHMNPDCSNHREVFAENIKDFWYFAGVFDGMGGGDFGELAAKTAAEVFLNAVKQTKKEFSQALMDAILRKAFLDANNKIVDLQQQYRVFGTTGTTLITNGTVTKIYHLGDSRAYLFRNGELFQLTRDQTLAQMKIDVGLYQPGDPQAEAEKHKLTEYIGRDQTKTHLRPQESEWFTSLPGDGFLLCSDGLYDMCSDREIMDMLQKHPETSQKANALVKAALSHGGADNISCVYLQFPDNF